MRISLQRDNGAEQPVYRQIAAQIRRQIDEQKLAAGARLPAIRDLAKSLKVHRDTVAPAYEELASAGVV
jgi:DNA-binding transcriptional regulator YhcF (GntR family)